MDRLWSPWRHAYVSTADDSRRGGVPEALGSWTGDTGCVFCNLLAASGDAAKQGSMTAEAADRAANIVYRGLQCFVCLNAFPYNSGHVMVLPYAHQADLARLEPAVAQEMMALAQKLDGILRKVYRPDGVNLGMNLGKAAGAGVAGHLHLHMVPRWTGDTNFMTVVAETRVLPESLEVTWEQLHREFDVSAEEAYAPGSLSS